MKKIIIAVLASAGLAAGMTACGGAAGSGLGTQADINSWADASLPKLQQTDDALNADDLDGATAAWQSIGTPPVDPSDWQKATDELVAIDTAWDAGDTATATQHLGPFEADLTAWEAAYTQATGYTAY